MMIKVALFSAEYFSVDSLPSLSIVVMNLSLPSLTVIESPISRVKTTFEPLTEASTI